jgi:hypothetical protein
VTVYVKTQLLDCFFVHYQAFATFEKTIMDWVRAHLLAMFTVAQAKLIHVTMIVGMVIVLDNL